MSLNNKYMSCNKILFVNSTEILKNHSEDVYVDNIHYTPFGNTIIAKYFFEIIKKFNIF